MKEKSIVDIIEEISGEKILRTEETPETEKTSKRGSSLKRYYEDIRTGKREHWSKGKVKIGKKWIKKEEVKKEEVKEETKEEPKPEIKLEEKPFDNEGEEIKKELGEKVTDERILAKNEKTEIKAEETTEEEPKKRINFTWVVYGVIGIGVLILIIQNLKKNPVSDDTPIETKPKKTRKFNVGGGKFIDVPIIPIR